MGNPTKRKKLLQAGYQKILDTLNGIVASDNGRPQSILYAPMARELNRLAVLRAHTKQAIFYTDAQENSDAFSMYREADISLLQSNPERVKALFEKQGSLGSLKGITVYLIYNAPTPFAESHFLLITNLWKQMFETHGAKVIVAPNLTTD
jgi:hypothetical protein